MEKIRIGGVPEHFNLPWQLWLDENKQKPAWRKEWIWTDFPGGSGAMIQALQEGHLDVALVLTEAVVNAQNSGIPLIPLSLYVESPLTWGIFSGSQNALENVDAGENVRYAISRKGSGSELMARVDAWIRKHKIKENQWVVVQNLAGAEKALTEGSADLFFWEKWMTRPLVDAGKLKLIDERPTPWGCFVLVSIGGRWIDSLEKDVHSAFEGVCQKAKFLMASTQSAAMISERYHLKEADARQWMQHIQWVNHWTDPHQELKKAREILDSVNRWHSN